MELSGAALVLGFVVGLIVFNYWLTGERHPKGFLIGIEIDHKLAPGNYRTLTSPGSWYEEHCLCKFCKKKLVLSSVRRYGGEGKRNWYWYACPDSTWLARNMYMYFSWTTKHTYRSLG